MRKCWELSPNDRPLFEELYKNTSKYIEHMAGYLELGFNPFARVSSSVDQKQTEGEVESEVAINVIPPSLNTSEGHLTYANTTVLD